MTQLCALQIDRRYLRLGAANLRFSLRHVEIADDPASAAIARKPQRSPKGSDALLQNGQLSIEESKCEIIDGEFGLNAQVDGSDFIRRRAEPGASGLDRATHASPEVEFPRGVERDGKVIEIVAHTGRDATVGLIGARPFSRVCGGGREVRKEVRAGDVYQRPCLVESRDGPGPLLIVPIGAILQPVELFIVENRPPGPPRKMSRRLGCFPFAPVSGGRPSKR